MFKSLYDEGFSHSLPLLFGEPIPHPASSCFVNKDILEKVFLQYLQLYFFTSECVCRCALRFDLSAKALEQCVHWNGFSPVCVRMCPCRSHGRENAFPQYLHLHGRVWVLMCIFNAPRDKYSLSQYLQLKIFLF